MLRRARRLLPNREIETPRKLRAGAGLKQSLDRLNQAFDAELSGSMSLNIRATALAGAAAVGILLLALFSAIWLDDNKWDLPDTWFTVQKVLLYVSLATLLICLPLAIAAAWPKRRWAQAQSDRVKAMAAGKAAEEAKLLLSMLESERATNERKSRLLRWSSLPAAIAVLAAAGQGVIFAAKAQTVDPFRVGAATPAEELADLGISEETQVELADRYAPRVVLHSAEPYLPLDPQTFIDGSSLVWNRDRRDERVVPRGEIESERLGRRCGEAAGGCYVGPTGFLSRELTRPANDRDRGFALDYGGPLKGGAPGGLAETPMFWEMRATPDELLLTYWFFYPYSRIHIGKNSRGQTSDNLFLNRLSHQGDWENIDVALSLDAAHDPLGVYYYGHGDPKRREWTAVCKLVDDTEECQSNEPGHPIVYSALKSHASYPTPGPPQALGCPGGSACAYDYRDAEGLVWEAWEREGGLLPAVDQPWYGFGGAWGEVTDGVDPGPLGPSRWKLPADPGPGPSVVVPQ